MSRSRAGKKILSYVIFHRHGQRAPTKNIYEASHTVPHHAPHLPLAEADTWQELLASPHELESLQELYPVDRHPDRGLQTDLNTKPFGCITSSGLENLEHQGRETLRAFPALGRAQSLEVYSTNYQRTQVSAQAFLKGLEVPAGTKVKVLASEDCPLSFYDHDPVLAVKLTKQVQNTPNFQQEEEDFVASHGGVLLDAVPELGSIRDVFTFNVPLDDSLSDAAGGIDVEKANPREQKRQRGGERAKRVNWMAALDYFSCRGAHELPVHPELDGSDIGHRMKEYVGSRFKLYYADEDFRRVAVLPMLKNVIVKEFSRRLGLSRDALDKGDQSPTVVIYSGHDVNLLGLLVTLNASLVHSDSSHWPDYGASIVFELVYDGGEKASRDRGGGGDSDSDGVQEPSAEDCAVNVYYNQQPLSIHLPPDNASTSHIHPSEAGDSVSHSMKLSELINYCENLARPW
mmetsp:Transcript_29569/g.49947  ORF Transcript_29569/g.49947 Transcript_29569/m.49947 type:complete len:459 (-) Transcript_29569:211-1587(-)|eukprot:CAMPEP_0114418368 /NCGR_PEP_ID=MMETSP0103-20121206/3458_1 /TAXON_ID=37642 ORGANISM="Paraphysomonas imperforata, Strain PA2" /NCGR_SAMPLE_ID=MMETSP0103 /ASSEMBLY_ACC=CAM_ASM_000201 /LENGTH=458 /DNA_ID=CAMNT_0001586719 /DNA_START=208 /DNA_END=1584 /DNA_ORIENTATION=-